MIARITGTIIEREEDSLIIDVGGVGYRVFVGSTAREKIKKGSEVSLRIYHHISDSNQSLYGFESGRELEYFELLLTVPSVGARIARHVLDAAPPRVLEQAVATDDITLLTKVSGVGKRTAERIIVELKEKIQPPKKISGVSGAIQHETVEALVSIGFTQTQARGAVQKLPTSVSSVEEAVKAALQKQGA